jgi:hypothetical protein
VKRLGKAFDTFNKLLFNNKLPPVEIVPDITKKCVFNLISPSTIVIGSNFVNVTLTEVLDELLHVMIHLANLSEGVVDYTSNQYHKRDFCERALAVGLHVVWHKTRGWGITSSNAEVVRRAKNFRSPDEAAVAHLKQVYKSIELTAKEVADLKSELRRAIKLNPRSSKKFQLKYVCGCNPPVIIRSGRRPDGPNPLRVRCELCGQLFVFES